MGVLFLVLLKYGGGDDYENQVPNVQTLVSFYLSDISTQSNSSSNPSHASRRAATVIGGHGGRKSDAQSSTGDGDPAQAPRGRAEADRRQRVRDFFFRVFFDGLSKFFLFLVCKAGTLSTNVFTQTLTDMT